MSAAFFVASLTIYLFPARAEKPPLSLSPSQLMALQAVRMGAMFATFGIMGRLSGWHFRRLPFHLMFLGLLVSLGLLAFNMTWGAYALCFAVFGCAASIGYVLSAYYSMLSPHRKGGMLGIHEALLSGGSMLGPLFGSQMIQMTGGNLHAPYSWSLLPLALTWLVCIMFLRRLPAR
jgi:MFS family permease